MKNLIPNLLVILLNNMSLSIRQVTRPGSLYPTESHSDADVEVAKQSALPHLWSLQGWEIANHGLEVSKYNVTDVPPKTVLQLCQLHYLLVCQKSKVKKLNLIYWKKID